VEWRRGGINLEKDYQGDRFLENARQVVIAAITTDRLCLHVSNATTQAQGSRVWNSLAAVTWITRSGAALCAVQP